MKKVIRNKVFETNSSSCHSILITKNDTHVTRDELIVNKDYSNYNSETLSIYGDGGLHLRNIGNGYGRYPFKFLTTFEDKLKYAMCEYMGHFYGDEPEFVDMFNEFISVVNEVIPEVEDFYVDTKDVDIYTDINGNELKHSQVRYDHYDADKHEYVYTYIDSDGNKQTAILSDNYLEVPDIGMIDHQSAGLLTNFLKEKGISLKEFLTNKKYVVVIDGDETCTFDKYLKAGLINKDFITEIYDTSGDDIEYQEWLKEQEEQ